jgi:hypothetical protein
MRSMQSRQAGISIIGWLVVVVIVGGLFTAAYLWLMLAWAYSDGERAGWVQKLSRKGYVCKTWEGEMAMVSLPGSVPEKFAFTVRDDAVAQQINQAMGRRVSLYYEEHIGLPGSCFGETSYFVKGVRVIEENLGGPMPSTAPPAPAPAPQAPKQ